MMNIRVCRLYSNEKLRINEVYYGDRKIGKLSE